MNSSGSFIREKTRVVLRGPDGEVKDEFECETTFSLADAISGKIPLDDFKRAVAKHFKDIIKKQGE